MFYPFDIPVKGSYINLVPIQPGNNDISSLSVISDGSWPTNRIDKGTSMLFFSDSTKDKKKCMYVFDQLSIIC